MKLYVEPADGPAFHRTFDTDSMVIGRASTSDLALADPFLSRHHARLFRAGATVLVEDLGSRNGTELNGVPIRKPTAVNPGDVIKVSGSTISFEDLGGNQPATTVDFGATIFRPASEVLREVESEVTGDRALSEADLRHYAARLRRINEVHEALGRSISQDELLSLILKRAFEELRPEQGVIFLRQSGGEFERVASRSERDAVDEDPDGGEIPLSRALIEEVCEKGMAAIVVDAATDERFSEAQSIIMSGLRSIVAAPLLDGSESLGMIVLSSKVAVREFREEDLEFLVSMASIAALKIRNVALTEDAVARRKLEEDLALARRIQVSLLPSSLPDVGGWDLEARNLPSRGVSGDYYQIIPRRDGAELVLVVSDVSGKGIPASLLTASLEALSAGPIEDGSSPAEICTVLSRRLFRRSPPEKYATAFIAVVDLATSAVTYANAGHNPALLLRTDGSAIELGPTGMPIGLVDGAEYQQEHLELAAGDLLLIYTDGVSEAESPGGEEFGVEGILASVAPRRDEPLDDILERLRTDLTRFTANLPAHDDRTVLLARRARGSEPTPAGDADAGGTAS
ncbi:MAG: FHA domain-containing protein [Acidobacteria bacterium]|nr:MAG: FHA domain-containing protein [Acidobacteriota bacterium]REK00221.1 MAG: FHA domain-containing protein [Acidobacteriota bacterium]